MKGVPLRIKSPFKDYYDGCLRLDTSPEPLYIRKTNVVDAPNHVGPYVHQYKGIFHPKLLGFCDKVFPLIKVVNEADESAYCFSAEEVERAIQTLLPPPFHKDYLSRRPRKGGVWGYMSPIKDVECVFATKTPWKNFSTREHPIWLTTQDATQRKWLLIQSPRLANYNFARILPPYQAYQNLRTWLSNQAAPREFIPEVSNDDMIASKGFDLRSSFRNDAPSGPARKRRKNSR